MKKILCLVAGALLMCAPAGAIPAKPGLFTVTQSDGTTLQVRQVGDEFHHSAVTADGLTVERGTDGDFYYTSAAGITSQRAHDAANRSAAERTFLAQNEGQFVFGAPAMTTARRARAQQAQALRRATQVPNNGSPRVPIILVQYKDKKMSNTKAKFEAQYKTNPKSVLQYFTDQSNGLYTPQFDIYGIYTLDNNRSTYGGNSGGSDKGVGRMVGEAISKAGDEIDWSLYDNDGDGEADVCIVVYAGVGEAQAYGVVPNAVWPCQWSLSAASYYEDGNGPVTRNGTTIDKFAVFNEVGGANDNGTTMDGVGTFCHEFSHCLGLPDFYETNYTGYYGMGSWSLMDSGCYNGGAVDGDTPIGYSAYEKNFMGWIDLITPQENTQYTLPVFNSKAIENDQAIKITALNNNEYWILENRRKQGWDYYIADEGVLITHFTYIASRWDDNSVNDKAIQLATIIPADNSLSAYTEDEDLYGEAKHEFTPNTTPAMRANMRANGQLAYSTGGAGAVSKPVTEITLNSDGTASLWYMKGTLPSLSAPVLADATGATTTSFTATWTHTPTADVSNTYTLNVTQGSTTVLNQTGITDMTYTVTDLEPGKTYTFKVKAVPVTASQATESAWSNVKTVTLPEEVRPVITATPAELAFGNVRVNESATQTFQLTGANLEGDVTLALTDPNGVYAIDNTTVSEAEATAGKAVTVTFTPQENVAYTATVELTSANARTVTMTLAGNGAHDVPLLLAADESQVRHTAFRADWSDDTPADFIDSYTLEVSYVPPTPERVLLAEADMSALTAVTGSGGSLTNLASNASNYLPEGWTVNNFLYVDNGAIIIREQSYASSNLRTSVTMPEGFDKVSVVVECAAHQGNSSAIETGLTVKTGTAGDSQSTMVTDDMASYTFVLNASANEEIQFNPNTTSTRYWAYLSIANIKIYAGDISEQASAPLLAAIENGDSLSRVITGITDKFYTVKDLAGGGTFSYKVKAVYTNQTESEWSNVERVTLAQEPDEPEYAQGDVNGDGHVDIDDVNILLNIILELDNADRYEGRANVDGTGKVDIDDVNVLINIILAQ